MKFSSLFNKKQLKEVSIFEILRKENPHYLYELGTDTEEYKIMLDEISKHDLEEFDIIELQAVAVLLKKFNPYLREKRQYCNFPILSDTNFGFIVDINLKYRGINPNPHGIIGLMTVEDAKNISGLKLSVQRKRGNFIDVQTILFDEPEAKKFFGIKKSYQRMGRMVYISRGNSIDEGYVIHHELDRYNHIKLCLLTKEEHDNIPVDVKHPKMLLSEFITQDKNITNAELMKYLNDIFILASSFNFVRGFHIDRDLLKNPLPDNESVVDLIKSIRFDQRFHKH